MKMIRSAATIAMLALTMAATPCLAEEVPKADEATIFHPIKIVKRQLAVKKGKDYIKALLAHGRQALDITKAAIDAYEVVHACSMRGGQDNTMNPFWNDELSYDKLQRGKCCYDGAVTSTANLIVQTVKNVTGFDKRELKVLEPLGVTSQNLNQIQDDVYIKFGQQVAKLGNLDEAARETLAAHKQVRKLCFASDAPMGGRN